MRLEVDYSAHRGQLKVHKSKAKFKAVLTGVGFGKSAILVNELLMWCIEKPSLYVIAAPTYPLLKNTTMREFFKFCPKELIQEYKIGDKLVLLKNGAEVLFVSGDDERSIERIRGLTIGGFGVDEVTLFPYLIWQILIARLRDPKGTMKGLIVGTPRGQQWTKTLFVDKKNPINNEFMPNPEDYEWFGGSSLQNPFTPEEYKKTLLSSYVGVFAEQEIYGKFVSKEGIVYPMFDRQIHVIDCQPLKPKMVDFIGGCDWGYSNPAVILVIGIDNDGRHYVFEEVYKRNMIDEEILARAKELKLKYGITKFWCDPSEPMMIKKFDYNGCNAEKADNSIIAGIAKMSAMLSIQGDGKPRLFIDKSCENFIKELELYRYEESKDGKPNKEQPIKMWDHANDACRYALMKQGEGKMAFALAEDPEHLVW